MISALSAVTLATVDMGRAVEFYRRLGFERRDSDERADFTTFAAGASFLNLVADPRAAAAPPRWWGRVVFHVDDVDALYAQALSAGLSPHAPPRDASWGERFFHITDPDGHELSFARPL